MGKTQKLVGKLDMHVPCAPSGIYNNATVIVARDTVWGFLRDADGKIFAVRNNRPARLTDGWGMNDRVRSAYAKAAGIRLKDLKEQIKRAREDERAQYNKREIERLRRSAERAGYKLVKVRGGAK